ncbi:maestro heat-like repeat-containing protein [Acrasis kona]|uniref:Maestro heat-like repeat-containing protein n=1 Tax=Acrasis kona TaxID=1008807 RepID=A0AAW2ZPV3_9EUKA
MSFFGFGKKANEDVGSVDTSKLTSPVYDTGRNVDGWLLPNELVTLIHGLINAINDDQPTVKTLIHESLCRIGDKEPLLVLSKGLNFLNTASRGQKNHRVLVMNVLTDIINSKVTLKIPEDLAQALAVMSTLEIVAEKSIDSDWQDSACKLLISMARVVPDTVARNLIDRFPANQIPHYFVVKALADFAHLYPELFLPHLKEILTRALPILALIKQDNIRWVFCAGLGRWAEAVVRVAKSDDKVTLSEYSGSMHAALKWCLNENLPLRNQKIRLVAAEAIGHLSHLIETEHLTALLKKIIVEMLALMKKEMKEDQLPVSIGYQNVIASAIKKNPQSLVEFMDGPNGLLVSTHQFLANAIRMEPTYNKSEQNQLQLNIVFEQLTKEFTDQVVTFLQKSIESKEAVRLATLRALRHMINNNASQLHSYKDLIVSALRLVTNENDLDLIYLIRDMGKQGYLQAISGEDLVSHVIKGSSSHLEPLRNECDGTMITFSTEYGDRMDPVLWPYLLTTIVPGDLTNAVPIVCKALSDIAKRKKNDDDFIIDFDRAVNLPKPNAVFARLLILLTAPHDRNSPGVNILRALYCLSPNIHPDLVETWSKRLPAMKRYLDENSESEGTKPSPSFNQDQWENLLLNFVRDSIDAVNDDEYTVSLGDALIAQCSLYPFNKALKRALLSTAGLIVQKTQLKDFVHRAIHSIFDQCDHGSEEERSGCARGLGQASASHTDIVLSKLSQVVKAPPPKKNFFGVSTPTGTGPTYDNKAKATACLAYGYVSMLTPSSLMVSRVEVHVINSLLPLLNGTKDFEVRENALRAVDLIGKACSSDRVGDEFVLKSRQEVCKAVVTVINTANDRVDKRVESPGGPGAAAYGNPLRTLGLEALSTLIQLPPKVESQVQNTILDCLLPLYKSATEDQIMVHVDEVMNDLLSCHADQSGLDALMTALEAPSRSDHVLERTRAAKSILLLLKSYARFIADQSSPSTTTGLTNISKYLARLIPRLTESQLEIRKMALDSIYLVLRIDHYLQHGDGVALSEHVSKVATLRSGLDAKDPSQLLFHAKELSMILVHVIRKDDLFPLVETCVMCLEDVDHDGANGSSVVLNGLIRSRGNELETQCAAFVRTLINSMNKLSKHEQLVTGLLHAVRSMTRIYPNICMSTLLSLPVGMETVRSWQHICLDRTLVEPCIEYLLDAMNNSQQYEEKRDANDVKMVGALLPKNATSALGSILTLNEMNVVAKKYYSRILIGALLRLGACSSMSSEAPIKDVELIIRHLMIVICRGLHQEDEEDEEEQDEDDDEEKIYDDRQLLDDMKSVWPLMNAVQYGEAIQSTLDMVCRAHSDLIREMFLIAKPFVNRTLIGVRVSATATCATLLSHIRNDRELVHDAINSLLSRSGTDEKVVVKLYSLRGLANLTKQNKDVLHKYVTPVTGALIANLEDTDEAVILETMKSVKIVFAVADDEYISPLLLNLCVRLKPAFEKSNPQIRESSILLFGELARFAKGTLSDTLVNNFFNNLPTIVLHLQDNDASVIRACKICLKNIVPQLSDHVGKELVDLFHGEGFDTNAADDADATNTAAPELSAELVDFDVFAEKFAKIFIKEFPNRISDLVMNLVVFYKSDWAGVCAGAVLIIGHLLANINSEMRARVNLRHTCAGLISLLRHQNPLIREKAGKVMGMLHEA